MEGARAVKLQQQHSHPPAVGLARVASQRRTAPRCCGDPTCTPVPEEEPKDRRWSCATLNPQPPGLVYFAAAVLAARRSRR